MATTAPWHRRAVPALASRYAIPRAVLPCSACPIDAPENRECRPVHRTRLRRRRLMDRASASFNLPYLAVPSMHQKIQHALKDEQKTNKNMHAGARRLSEFCGGYHLRIAQIHEVSARAVTVRRRPITSYLRRRSSALLPQNARSVKTGRAQHTRCRIYTVVVIEHPATGFYFPVQRPRCAEL